LTHLQLAPIAWQLREMADDGFVLDAILTVIDCVNFTGYEDTSYTAKMQAKYTDLILLNKHELVSERDLDIVIDHVNELNTDTPKITVDKDKGLSPDVAFGLDTKLFQITHHSDKAHMKDLDHHAREVDIIQLIRVRGEDTPITLSRTELVKFLESLPTEEVYRVKGFVRFQEDPNSIWIVNCAFGRCTLTEMTQPSDAWANDLVRITVMGRELRFLQSRLASGFQIPNDAAHVKTYWRPVGHH
jgi:G3E family GTPase